MLLSKQQAHTGHMELDSMAFRHQLRYALSGCNSRDLEQTSVAAARAVLREVRHNRAQLRACFQEVLTGKHQCSRGWGEC